MSSSNWGLLCSTISIFALGQAFWPSMPVPSTTSRPVRIPAHACAHLAADDTVSPATLQP